ncbi:MAG: primosomal protein N', partial [Pseudomonadota bacterium]
MPLTIFRIALDVPLNRLFDYLSGDFAAQVGCRVVVPFAGRNLIGVIIAITHESEFPIEKLKPVSHVFDEVILDSLSFKLLNFCADYYHYPLGQALISTLPLRLRQIKPATSRKMFAYRLSEQADMALVSPKKVVMQRILTALHAKQEVTEAELALISSTWRKAIAELKTLNLVASHEVTAIKASLPTSAIAPDLNAEQKKSIDCVLALTHNFKPWLLYGVTGSGKTEVYIQILGQILSQKNAQGIGAQVLVL